MKKILLTLLALLTVAPLLAQSDTLTLGYCKGAVASEGMATQKGNTWVSAAIQLPGETMEAYQGNSVAQVRVALCSRSNIDTLRVWVRKTLKGENLAEGYITKVALDKNGEAIGYQFVRLGKMMEDIRHGVNAEEALKKNTGTYGRFADAPKYIDPREE